MTKRYDFFPIQTVDLQLLEKELEQERQGLVSQLEAVNKILPLRRELNALAKTDYQPEVTVDEEPDGSKSHSKEFEFDKAYTDPERATRMIIELFQLELQRQGKKRMNIIPFEKGLAFQKSRLISLKNNGQTSTEVSPESV